MHLHHIGKAWKLSKWVPRELTEGNRLQRVSICSSLISCQKKELFLYFLLTCDEKWILYTSHGQLHHWLSPMDPIPHSAKAPLHPKKHMLCFWWTSAGIVHHKFLPQAQTNHYGLGLQLEHVQVMNRKKVQFLQDNEKPHNVKVIHNEITTLEWELLLYPPYSPDIFPSDYHLFRALDTHM